MPGITKTAAAPAPAPRRASRRLLTYFFAGFEYENRVRGHEGPFFFIPGPPAAAGGAPLFLRSRRVDPRVAERGLSPPRRRLGERLVALGLLAGTLAHDDVALEVHPVRVGELEHGEEVGLGDATDRIVLERRQDRGIGTTAVEYILNTLNI